MKKTEIVQISKVADVAQIPDGRKLMLICVNRTIEDALSLYDKVRYSWKVSIEKATGRLVLAVAFGLIVGVFEVDEWLRATQDNFGEIPDYHGNWRRQDGRYGFRGHQAPKELARSYVDKRVPDELRNHGSPIRYVS